MPSNFKPQTIVQLKNEHNQYIQNNHFEEDILNSRTKKNIMSFNDLKNSVPNPIKIDTSNIFVEFLTVLLSMFILFDLMCVISNNVFWSLIICCSGIFILFPSIFLFYFLKFNKTIKKEENQKQQYISFLNDFKQTSSSHIILALQTNFYQELESKNIKTFNHYAHSHLKESIDCLKNDFDTLHRKIELQEKTLNYSFEPFRKFLTICSTLSADIKSVDNTYS